MPRPRIHPAIKKLKAIKTAKTLMKAGGKIAVMAKNEGITYQAAKERIQNPLVHEELGKLLDGVGATDNVWAKAVADGLTWNDKKSITVGRGKSKKVVSLKIPNGELRIKTCELFAKLKGFLKPAEAGPSGMIIMIPGGYDNIL